MSNSYWSDIVHQLDPYVPGEQPKHDRLVKLNTNENPYGPSPKVLNALAGEASDELRLYPDPNAEVLKQTIAAYYDVAPDQVFVGNGSDEVLAHIFCGLLKQSKPLLFPDITYSFYPVYCGLYQIDYQQIPLADNFSMDFSQYPVDNGGIIFPNPNAPTGLLQPLEAIEALLQQHTQSVVVVDEAYIDFGGESAIGLVSRYPNLLVTQTLSKSRSLAGLRVGLAVGDASLIEGLERVKNSFNSYPLSRFAQAGAVAAFADEDYFQQTCHKVIAERKQLADALRKLGFSVLPSAANFLFVRVSEQHDTVPGAAELSGLLREQGVIVRHFKQPRIVDFLRITVGTAEQNRALLNKLSAIIG